MFFIQVYGLSDHQGETIMILLVVLLKGNTGDRPTYIYPTYSLALASMPFGDPGLGTRRRLPSLFTHVNTMRLQTETETTKTRTDEEGGWRDRSRWW